MAITSVQTWHSHQKHCLMYPYCAIFCRRSCPNLLEDYLQRKNGEKDKKNTKRKKKTKAFSVNVNNFKLRFPVHCIEQAWKLQPAAAIWTIYLRCISTCRDSCIQRAARESARSQTWSHITWCELSQIKPPTKSAEKLSASAKLAYWWKFPSAPCSRRRLRKIIEIWKHYTEERRKWNKNFISLILQCTFPGLSRFL